MGRRIDALSALLAFVASLHAGMEREEDWQPVWKAFLSLRKTDPSSAVDSARSLSSGLEDPIRRHLLDAVAGEDGALDLVKDDLQEFQSLSGWPLTSIESWIAARVLPPGGARSMCVLAALHKDPEALEPDHIILANEVGMELAEDLRLDEAIRLQRALHARCAAEWSAVNLAMSLKRMGAYQEASEILATQEERGASADLRAQRAILELACGDEMSGRELLGSCLGNGSLDAAQVLARLDLASARLVAARRGFGALLTAEKPGPWALYGWGLALAEPPLGVSAGNVSDLERAVTRDLQ